MSLRVPINMLLCRLDRYCSEALPTGGNKFRSLAGYKEVYAYVFDLVHILHAYAGPLACEKKSCLFNPISLMLVALCCGLARACHLHLNHLRGKETREPPSTLRQF